MYLTDEQTRLIEDFATRRYALLDSTHGLSHGQRTARLAAWIAEREQANQEICRLGGLLHQYHPENASLVDEYLKAIHVDDFLRSQLVHCVECVTPETINRARTIEARIVFDADKLQTLGPFGLVREVAYRMLTRGVNFQTAIAQSQELQVLMTGLLQTKTARDLAQELNGSMETIFPMIERWEHLSFIDSKNH